MSKKHKTRRKALNQAQTDVLLSLHNALSSPKVLHVHMDKENVHVARVFVETGERAPASVIKSRLCRELAGYLFMNNLVAFDFNDADIREPWDYRKGLVVEGRIAVVVPKNYGGKLL